MNTLTVKYDANNALAMSVIALMMQTGVFEVVDTYDYQDFASAEEEKSVFLCTSQANASKIFANHLSE